MQLSKRDLYRFPWSGNDNPIGWLEVTDKCNTYCRGCYRINGMQGHKSFDQIKEEIALLKKWRNCDNISIAGGEPLIHPQILDIVAYIRSLKMKPLILTNGIKLENNQPFMVELKKAGVVGFTFHIDSEQQRPHWKGKSEEELFELRQHLRRHGARGRRAVRQLRHDRLPRQYRLRARSWSRGRTRTSTACTGWC